LLTNNIAAFVNLVLPLVVVLILQAVCVFEPPDLHELINDFVLLLDVISKLNVVLDHFVAPSLDIMEEWTRLDGVMRLTNCIFQEIQAVLGRAEAALEQGVVLLSTGVAIARS